MTAYGRYRTKIGRCVSVRDLKIPLPLYTNNLTLYNISNYFVVFIHCINGTHIALLRLEMSYRGSI